MPRLKDQRLIAFATPCMSLAGFIGLWLMPEWALVWVLLLGAGSGASFILALSFMGLRARDAMQSASLSSMAQTLGYLLAAMGPLQVAGATPTLPTEYLISGPKMHIMEGFLPLGWAVACGTRLRPNGRCWPM